MRRSQIFAGVAAVVLVAGVGVALLDGGGARNADTSGTFDSSVSSNRARSSGDELGAPALAKGAAGGGATDAAVARQAAVAPAGPRVVKTASLTVTVAKAKSVAEAARRANAIAEGHGGFVASTDIQTGEKGFSTLTLRVPVSAYDVALGELRALGEVSNESLGGQDVTNALVDLDARLRSLRAQETALNGLMAKATTVGETLQVAQAVADVRTQVEQLAAQQKSIADQADFATITLAVVGPAGAIGEAEPQPLLVHAFERAVGGALEVVGGAILAIGYALPAGLFAMVGYLIWRFANRRKVPTAA